MSEEEVISESAISYSFTQVISITGVNRETIVEYCEQGLLPVPAKQVENTEFDDRLLSLLRRVEALRTIHGVNFAGIQMILSLSEELESLRRELRFRVDEGT